MKHASFLSTICLFLFALAFCVFPENANAHTPKLLVRQTAYTAEHLGYGQSNWTSMTELMNSAFGGSGNITVVSNFDSATLTDYDALWIDLGNTDGSAGNALSSTEISKIQAFVGTGRRVVMVGEHANSWNTWDSSILSVVDGSVSATHLAVDTLTSVYTHDLTTSVSSIRANIYSESSGGISLFSKSVATLWGASNNVLVTLESNAWDDTGISALDDQRYAQNTANWIFNGPHISDANISGTGQIGGPSYDGIVSWAQTALCGNKHSGGNVLLKGALCTKLNGKDAVVKKLHANTNVMLFATVQYQDQAKVVTLRVFGKKYTFSHSNKFEIYTAMLKTPRDPGSYPYTLTINYEGLTVSEKGLLVVK